MTPHLIKNPYPGRFVTFEGIDGSGKSDQFRMVHDDLVAISNLNVIFTKEPPNNPVGVEIYDILRGHHPEIRFEDLSELEMQRKYFLARRMQYQDVNLPALRAGIHVISDRGVVSVAYGVSSVSDLDHFFGIQRAMFDYCHVPFVAPDLNLIFDVNVDVALNRLGEKVRIRDKFEQKDVLERTRANYLEITKQIPNCVVVDGTPSVEEVYKVTRQHIFKLLGITL